MLTTPSTGHRFVRHHIASYIKYVVPLAISVALIYWLTQRVDFHEVWHTIRRGCDFRWIALMMVITAVSHMIRGVRWGIQLRAVGVERMPVPAEWCIIWGAYALNLIFPQLGEGWRCLYVSRRCDARLSTVIGTDVGDRFSDLVIILALLGVALIVAHPQIMDFVQRYSFGRDISHLFDFFWFWIGVASFLAVIWYFFHFHRYYKWVKQIDSDLTQVWAGVKIIFTMRRRWTYLGLSLAIWTCYFLETYLCFMAFPFTRHLMEDPGMAAGLLPGLVVFVFGSCSMAVPSNGGLGPWNVAVIFGLTLFGITTTEATAYSMVMWSMQAITYIVLGIFSAVYLYAGNRSTPSTVRTISAR